MTSATCQQTLQCAADPALIRGAWAGRVAGCQLGRPLEVLSFREGRAGITRYLERAGAVPLRGFVPCIAGTIVERRSASCAGHMHRAEPDDDIDYSVLALMLLERHGASFTREDVARQWLLNLPAGRTWTAERAAYSTLLTRMDDQFVNGAAPGFDLEACSDNPWNDCIGGQIRADVYGWVLPGRPREAASLAARDASLSHRGDGVHAAAFVAALGALLGAGLPLADAIEDALAEIDPDSGVVEAVRFAAGIAQSGQDETAIMRHFEHLPPFHCLNNLAIVVWALGQAAGDFDRAVCGAVSAGLDTDCNGATVGGLCGIAGWDIGPQWIEPWRERICLGLAGVAQCSLDELAARTVAVARQLESAP